MRFYLMCAVRWWVGAMRWSSLTYESVPEVQLLGLAFRIRRKILCPH